MATQKALVLSFEDAEALIVIGAILEKFEATEEIILDEITDLKPDEPIEKAKVIMQRWKTILANAHHFTGIPGGGRHSGE